MFLVDPVGLRQTNEFLSLSSSFIYHCVKSVRIRSYSNPHFSHIRIEYGEIRSISPYSVRKRGNADQNNSEYEHFLRNI